MTIRTHYLKTVFDPKVFPLTVRKTVRKARELKRKHNYDTIAFCGMSGAAMAFILARSVRVPILCVRKHGDGSHYWQITQDRAEASCLEGNLNARKYLIVDDWICTGTTVRYIIDSIRRDIPEAECVSMLMYAAYTDEGWCYQDKRYEVTSSRPDNI